MIAQRARHSAATADSEAATNCPLRSHDHSQDRRCLCLQWPGRSTAPSGSTISIGSAVLWAAADGGDGSGCVQLQTWAAAAE